MRRVGPELGIHVTAEYQGSDEDVHQKLQAAYVAGDTPDVTVMEIGSIGTFARNGVLIPYRRIHRAGRHRYGRFLLRPDGQL